MFSRLIASRPTPRKDAAGLAFSALLHGSVIVAAVLATETGRDALGVTPPSRVILLPALPNPAPPESPRASAAPATAARPVPVPSPVAIAPPSLPAPTAIPTAIPAPSAAPWTEPVPGGIPGGTGEAPITGASPAAGPAAGGIHSDEQVDEPAALLPRSALPRYPDALRSWRVEGFARLRFVVGADGRVEPEGIEVLESSHPAFAAAVRATLPRMRFKPARVGDRPVRQLVEFPITFKLDP